MRANYSRVNFPVGYRAKGIFVHCMIFFKY
jgi:hypothetical protein